MLALLGSILQSPKLREEVVKTGSSEPETSDNSLQVLISCILGRLSDKGFNVMKLAVAILDKVLSTQLLRHQVSLERRTYVELLLSMKQSDIRLREMVVRIFRHIWFGVAFDISDVKGELLLQDEIEPGEKPEEVNPLSPTNCIIDVLCSVCQGDLLEFADENPLVETLSYMLKPGKQKAAQEAVDAVLSGLRKG